MKRLSLARSKQPLSSILLGVLFVLLVPSLHGQGFGSIQGNVIDPSGAALSSAIVTATEVKTSIAVKAKVNSRGFYVFPSLPPSTYSLSVVVPGFAKYEESDLILQADQTLTSNITLKVGGAAETVSVSAVTNTVDLVSGTLSRVVDGEEINELPLNGRNAAVLTELAAGVVLAPNDAADQGNTKTFPVVVTVSVNGSLPNQTDYMLDGGNNLDEYTNVNQPFPFPDALQEFSVQTNNYNAEYGQNAGGVVNIVTKSGGAQYHGDVFEYIRNAAFNAKSYQFTSVVSPRDPLKRNQFGGTIGGPIKIPHLLSGKHTFFFFGYQKNHITDAASSSTSYVPTQAELNGDFSALCTTGFNTSGICTTASQQITDPINLTGGKPTPFPFNKVLTTRYDPAAVALDKVLPQSAGTGQVSFGNPSVQNYNEYFSRVDQELGTKDHLFGHYFYDKFDNVGFLNPTNLLTTSADSNIVDQSALISETHIFTPKLLNTLVVNFSRDNAHRQPPAGSVGPNAFGVNVYVPSPASIQSVSVAGAFTVGVSQPALFGRENYTLGDDFHIVKGNHSFAVGVHAEISRVNINSTTSSGTYSFTTTNTNSSILSYLLGYMSSFGQTTGQRFSGRDNFWGVYGQDSWKVSQKLSITYGLRYEPFKPWFEKFHRFEVFDPAGYAAGRVSTQFPNAPAGMYFSGDQGIPVNGSSGSNTVFMPRFGFAYDPFGQGNTVVRGGGGVFYDARVEAFNYASVTNNNPFTLAVSYTYPAGPFSNPYLGQTNPFPAPPVLTSTAVFPTPVSVAGAALHIPDPVSYDWNLTVEQRLTKDLGFRLAYVGNHGSHIRTGTQLNPALQTGFPCNSVDGTITGGTCTPAALSTKNEQARRPFGCTAATENTTCVSAFSSIKVQGTGSPSNYDGLQATLQERLHLVDFVFNYTFSKVLTTVPYSDFVFPIYTPNYKRLDFGPQDNNVKHNFSASYVFRVPTIRSGFAVTRAIVNGWQTTGTIQARTGYPLTVVSGNDVSLTNIGSDRANEVPNVNPYGSTRLQFINPAAFTQPALGTFGNTPKGQLNGPGYIDVDAGLQRNFPLYERFHGEFRAEYFNVLNHPNFQAPSTTLSSSSFGVLNAEVSDGFRIGQLALKIIF